MQLYVCAAKTLMEPYTDLASEIGAVLVDDNDTILFT